MKRLHQDSMTLRAAVWTKVRKLMAFISNRVATWRYCFAFDLNRSKVPLFLRVPVVFARAFWFAFGGITDTAPHDTTAVTNASLYEPLSAITTSVSWATSSISA